MKRITGILVLLLCCVDGSAQVSVGAADTTAYFPKIDGRRIAMLANQTSVVGEIHLVDILNDRGFDIVGIFAPEHGFRGEADAGEHVRNSVDAKTGIPILSLYNGNAMRPDEQTMLSFDILVVDMQDVGLRFYTYYISMIRMMDACVDYARRVIILDRPNPNNYVDGPILDMKYKSGVGALPIPVVHGLTMGEIALMSVGEGWCKPCEVEVVKCRNYSRSTRYVLPIPPSPNLLSQNAVYLYPSTCMFEGTVVSPGRGTDRPFEIYGHPNMKGCDFSFTPRPNAGAKNPLFDGEICYGRDLGRLADSVISKRGVDLSYVIEAYGKLGLGEKFFKPMFEKLIGVGYVRRMIIEGRSAEEIKSMWRGDVERFEDRRKQYLLYPETLTD